MQWGIESVAAALAVPGGATPFGAMPIDALPGTVAPDAFANLMRRELEGLNTSVGVAETAMRDLAAGKAVELHDVMIRLEHARMSVQTFVQMRNKLIESYQDLMRMQL